MAIVFYPHIGEMVVGTFEEKLSALLQAANHYQAAILDSEPTLQRHALPRDIKLSMNWDELAKVLHEIRDLTESAPNSKSRKATYLTKLAKIYEVLREAKMPKLEAVRIALINEAKRLAQNGSIQVA